jgi:uncharacterized membrane protein YbhN (UPF0104 family)
MAIALAIVGPERLLNSLAGTELRWFALALGLAIAANVCSSLRWGMIARALGLNAPDLSLMPMYARGVTSNTLLPGATVSGDLLRSYELSRLGNPMVESAASVAFDRFSGLWTLCVLSFMAAAVAWVMGYDLAGSQSNRAVLPAYGLLLSGIVLAPFLPWPISWIRRLPGALGNKVADLWARMHAPGTALRRRLAESLVLSIGVQVLSALALVACARSLGVQTALVLLLAASAPIFVMAAVPLGVAGFGTRELASVAVLGAMGVPPDQAAGTGLLYGLCGVIMGLLAAPLFVFRGRPT